MITMYHPKTEQQVSVHAEQVLTMQSRGWTVKAPTAKRKAKIKVEPIPAESTNEVNSDG